MVHNPAPFGAAVQPSKEKLYMPFNQYTKTRYRFSGAVPLALSVEDYLDTFGNPHSRTSDVDFAYSFGCKETLSSVSHKGPPYKEGGPFMMTRFSARRSLATRSWESKRPQDSTSLLLRESYSGPGIDGSSDCLSLVPKTITKEFLDTKYTAMVFPSQDLSSYGPTAIARMSPLRPSANVGQFLVELHDLPKLPLKMFTKAGFFKALGSEYLNAEFGWKPFVKDLQDMYKTWQSVDSRIRQLVRDNGKPVRRRISLTHDVDTIEDIPQPLHQLRVYPNGWGETVDNTINHHGSKCTRKVMAYTDIWANGRFRYYMFYNSDNHWNDKARLALFGLNPTPALLWEVMPWSWLIDWFGNIGDVITNLSSNGIADLIIDYAYIMRRYRKTTGYYMTTYPTYVNPWGEQSDLVRIPPVSLITEVVEERKERVAASPFGFGLHIDDLSARQYAILVSLGLSRNNFIS
jgi:hypothetical protein